MKSIGSLKDTIANVQKILHAHTAAATEGTDTTISAQLTGQVDLAVQQCNSLSSEIEVWKAGNVKLIAERRQLQAELQKVKGELTKAQEASGAPVTLLHNSSFTSPGPATPHQADRMLLNSGGSGVFPSGGGAESPLDRNGGGSWCFGEDVVGGGSLHAANSFLGGVSTPNGATNQNYAAGRVGAKSVADSSEKPPAAMRRAPSMSGGNRTPSLSTPRGGLDHYGGGSHVEADRASVLTRSSDASKGGATSGMGGRRASMKSEDGGRGGKQRSTTTTTTTRGGNNYSNTNSSDPKGGKGMNVNLRDVVIVGGHVVDPLVAGLGVVGGLLLGTLVSVLRRH